MMALQQLKYAIGSKGTEQCRKKLKIVNIYTCLKMQRNYFTNVKSIYIKVCKRIYNSNPMVGIILPMQFANQRYKVVDTNYTAICWQFQCISSPVFNYGAHISQHPLLFIKFISLIWIKARCHRILSWE